MALDKPYADVPGTTIFDADMARRGYHLNQFCMSLMKQENRECFKENERAYVDEWPMTEEQKQGVLTRDNNRMIAAGGNKYFLAKIFATDGQSFEQAAASRHTARITAGVCTSHVPAIGAAIDLGKTEDDYWKPVFGGYEFSKQWISEEKPDVIFLVYNDHATMPHVDYVREAGSEGVASLLPRACLEYGGWSRHLREHRMKTKGRFS